MLLLLLIGGVSSQFEPTEEQDECFSNYIAEHSDDPAVQVLSSCVDDSESDDGFIALCQNETCLNSLDTLYKRCGFNNLRQSECLNILQYVDRSVVAR